MGKRDHMKVLKMLFCLSVLFVVASTTPIEAHPGRTDGNGCHVCRTNCADWGLQQDEYHCHNGGGSSSSGTTQAPVAPTPEAVAPVAPVVEVYTPPVIDYKALGNSDGYTFKKNNPNASLSDAGYSYEDTTYKEEYNSAFKQAAKELSENSIKQASEKGRTDALLYTTYNFDNEPVDVIKNEYETHYKKKFDETVSEAKAELAKSADGNAYQKTFNDVETTEVKDYGLTNYKEYYKKEYESNIKKYKTEKNIWMNKAIEQGKTDKINGDKKSYAFMKKMSYTKLYGELKKAYDKSYNNSEPADASVLVIPIAMYIFITMIALFIAVKKQKKYHNRLKINC